MPPLYSRNPRKRVGYQLTAAAVAALAFLVLLSGQVLGSGSAGGSNVVVGPGQSLWSIAADHPASGDIRSRIDELIEVNHLAGPTALYAGQELWIPNN